MKPFTFILAIFALAVIVWLSVGGAHSVAVIRSDEASTDGGHTQVPAGNSFPDEAFKSRTVEIHADLIRINDQEYKDATIVSIGPSTISIRHADGAATLSSEKLDDQTKKVIEYNPELDQANRNAIEAKKSAEVSRIRDVKRSKEEIENALVMRCRVLQVLSDGCIVVDEYNGQRIFLKGATDTVEGRLYEVRGYTDGVYSYTTVLGAPSTIQAWRVVHKY